VSDSKSLGGVQNSLWFVPVMCVLLGLVLSFSTVAIDRAFDYELIPRSLTGGPDGALAILETIATSMVSLTALVLTITMVVVQLAMGQFSPRIVQTFLRDRPSQVAIGLFVATFAHAMVAMREVGTEEDKVPGLAIVVSYVLVLTSIAMLVVYVEHIGRSLRVSALIELVGNDTRDLLDRYYPASDDGARSDDRTVVNRDSGVLTVIDRDRLVRLARDAGCSLEVVPAYGVFVPAGAPLVRVHGDASRLDRNAVVSALTLSLERTMDEDVAYGFRMLVDVAERSLSESPFLDPTTAVQAIDRLHDGLRQLATRDFPDGRHYDDDGQLRLTVPVMDWDAYVHLAFDEIRLSGASSPQISRRLIAALYDLLSVAPHERRPVLEEQLRLLHHQIGELQREPDDRGFALVPDAQGMGAAGGRAD
jgi:uncharacterized membrane protein